MIQLSKSEILVIYFCGRVKPRSTLHMQLRGILLNSINPGEKRNPQSVETRFLLRNSYRKSPVYNPWTQKDIHLLQPQHSRAALGLFHERGRQDQT